MKNQRPISEQIEHEDVPGYDDLDPEPTAQNVPVGYITYTAIAILIIGMLVAVFA